MQQCFSLPKKQKKKKTILDFLENFESIVNSTIFALI